MGTAVMTLRDQERGGGWMRSLLRSCVAVSASASVCRSMCKGKRCGWGRPPVGQGDGHKVTLILVTFPHSCLPAPRFRNMSSVCTWKEYLPLKCKEMVTSKRAHSLIFNWKYNYEVGRMLASTCSVPAFPADRMQRKASFRTRRTR